MHEALQAPVAGTERNTGHGHEAGYSEDTAAAGRPCTTRTMQSMHLSTSPKELADQVVEITG